MIILRTFYHAALSVESVCHTVIPNVLACFLVVLHTTDNTNEAIEQVVSQLQWFLGLI